LILKHDSDSTGETCHAHPPGRAIALVIGFGTFIAFPLPLRATPPETSETKSRDGRESDETMRLIDAELPNFS
jgi:hypothetical protein